MTRMEAERAAYANNGDKYLKRSGQWIAEPGPQATLLSGWHLALVLKNGTIVRAKNDAQGSVRHGRFSSADAA